MINNPIIIKEIFLTNFRNLDKVYIKFHENITNIVGLSSSGKTNLLEIFELFNNQKLIQESDIPRNIPSIQKEDIEIRFKLNSEFFKYTNDLIKDDFYLVFKGGKKEYKLRKYPKRKLDDDLYNEIIKNIHIWYRTFHIGRYLLEDGSFKEVLSRPSFYAFLYNMFEVCDINLKSFIEDDKSENKQLVLEGINIKVNNILQKLSDTFNTLTLKISLQNDEKFIIEFFQKGTKIDISSKNIGFQKSFSLLFALKAAFNKEIENSVILLDELWFHKNTVGYKDIQGELLKLSKKNQVIYSSRSNFEFADNQIGKIINFDNEIKIQKLEHSAIFREKLLMSIIKESRPIENFPDNNNFLVLGRQWNSWYPSSFELVGGCYFFNINQEIIIIDPGFKTLDIIKEKNLDIRLIRYIFVTHFHPDHFENLIKLITRLTSKANKLTVYLNSTAFEQFKIYSQSYTEFNSLKPGVVIQLYEYNEEKDFRLEFEVGRAFHREIGGYMNSISLKFILTNNQTGKTYIVGFFGDTDGSTKYIDGYINFFNDCNIIIPHLGAIQKKPIGYKHLYKKGMMKILEKLDSKKFVFIGEYGFELASEQSFKHILKELIPVHIKYNKLIKTFHSSSKYPNVIGDLYTPIYDFMVNKLSSIDINLELILPFMILSNKDLLEPTIDEFDIRNIKKLNLINDEFKNNYNEKDFISIWRGFLKLIIFQAAPFAKIQNLINKYCKLWGLKSIMENYGILISKFFDFFTNDIKINFLNKAIFTMTTYPIFLNIKIEDIKKFIKMDVEYYEYLPAIDRIEHFPGVSQEIKEYFINNELWAIILIFYIKFVMELLKKKKFLRFPFIGDGREIICKYLNAQFIHEILPVHPSYKIIFGDNILHIRGQCNRCSDVKTIGLTQYNNNWTIHSAIKKYKKTHVKIDGKQENCCIPIIYPEYIDIVPHELCSSCKVINYEEEGFQIAESKIIEQQYQQEIEDIGEAIIEANKHIKNIKSPMSIFALLNNLYDNNIAFNLDPELWVSKLNEIIENDKYDDYLIHEVLIHPNLQINQKLKEFIIDYFNRKSKDEIKQIFNHIITTPILYDNPSGDIIYDYYRIFDNKEFLEVFMSKIEKLNIKELVNFTKYLYNRKSKRDKNQKDNLQNFFKKQFVKSFFPLIEDTENKIEEYKILRNNTNFFNQINSLGYPFSNYARVLRNNLRRLKHHFRSENE